MEVITTELDENGRGIASNIAAAINENTVMVTASALLSASDITLAFSSLSDPQPMSNKLIIRIMEFEIFIVSTSAFDY